MTHLINRYIKSRTIGIDNIVILISAYFLSLFLLTVFSVETGYYSLILIKVLFSVFIFLLIATISVIVRNRIRITISKHDYLALFLIVLFCLLTLYYFHEPFAGGRDDGVYANLGTYISKNFSYKIKDDIVRTYPGFLMVRNTLTSEFYLGYPAWIAVFINLFGIKNISFVNIPLIFIGVVALYFFSKEISTPKSAIIAITLLMTSYPFNWFTRKTFSENLLFMLFWLGALCLIKVYKNKNGIYFYIILVSIGTSLVTRVEGLFYLGALIIVLVLFNIKGYFRTIYLYIFLLLIIIPSIYYYIVIDPRYFTMIISKISGLLKILGINSTQSTLNQTSDIPAETSIIENKQTYFALYLLNQYNFYIFILSIPLALIHDFFRDNKKKAYTIVFTLLLLLPNFIFLIKPNINYDQPWFLRRYMPVILPFGIVMFSKLGSSIFKRTFFLILTCAVLIINMLNSSPILVFSEFHGAYKSTLNNLSQIITGRDLLIVDYGSTGHYKLAEPLYFQSGFNSVAALPFSLDQLFDKPGTQKIELYSSDSFQLQPQMLCKYNDVYILTSESGKVNFLSEIDASNLSRIKQFSITYKELIKTCELFRLTQNKTFEEMANINFDSALTFCKDIPDQIVTNSQLLSLYKVNETFVNLIKNKHCI